MYFWYQKVQSNTWIMGNLKIMVCFSTKMLRRWKETKEKRWWVTMATMEMVTINCETFGNTNLTLSSFALISQFCHNVFATWYLFFEEIPYLWHTPSTFEAPVQARLDGLMKFNHPVLYSGFIKRLIDHKSVVVIDRIGSAMFGFALNISSIKGCGRSITGCGRSITCHNQSDSFGYLHLL